MKIGRVFPTFQTDLLYTEHYLAQELKKKGHETVFITSDKYMPMWDKYISRKDGAGYYEFDDFSVHRLKSLFPLQKAIFKSFRQLQRIIEDESFDVLHLYGIGTFTTLQILFLSLLKKRSFPLVVISDHSTRQTNVRQGLAFKLFNWFYSFCLGFLLNKNMSLITFSNNNSLYLANRYKIPLERFIVIPLGYDAEFFKIKSSNLRSNSFRIGFAGKINQAKRIDLLINAIADLNIDNVELRLAGFSNSEYCIKLKSLAESKNIRADFLPLLNRQQLVEFYNSLDLAVFPGSISITTIEASGCGVPIVLYESIPDLEERISYERGTLFRTYDELKKAINCYYKIFSKKEANRKLIAERTEESHSWRRIADKYLAVYMKHDL